MKIGLTYDLRTEYLSAGYSEEQTAEFDREETIAAIESALQFMGHQTDRIGNARELIRRLAAGNRWELVFNIAEGLNGIGREAQVPAILDVYGIAYTFSDPLVMSLTLHKGMTKAVVRDAGIPTSDYAVIDDPHGSMGLAFDPPYFIKPVAEGTGKGVTPESIIFHRENLADACSRLIASFHQPVLVEQFLPGREFTVGLVGSGEEAEALGTMEVLLLDNAEPNVYSYVNKENSEALVTYRILRADEDPLAASVEKIALDAWRTLGCRDAGRIDLRCDSAGMPQFIEVNPLAGLHPWHSDLPIMCNELGFGYAKLIARIIASASKRIRIDKEMVSDAHRIGL